MNSMNPETEWSRAWSAPPELGYSQPRPVRLTKSGVAVMWLAALMLAGAVVLAVVTTGISRRQVRERDLLAREGVTAEARVDRLWRSSGKDKQRWVEYSFNAEGQRITARSKAPREAWEAMQQGSALAVRYAPSRPALNHPEEWPSPALPSAVPPLAALGVLIPAFVIFYSVRRQKAMLADGRPAPGRITQLKRAPKGQTVQQYEFVTLSGSVAQGRTQAGGKPAPVGTIVTVLYDPDNPRRNTLYPMCMVKPDLG